MKHDMKNSNLIRAALRCRALYIDIDSADIDMSSAPAAPHVAFFARLAENGFCVSEELLHAVCAIGADYLAHVTEIINDVMGVNLNWATLVKGWNVPTGESLADHFVTLFSNVLKDSVEFRSTTLPCGHLIPEGTFPIERYTGCPFCGTPFETADFVYHGQASRLKELRLFTRSDMLKLLESLLTSAVPLDATQSDTLRILLKEFPLSASVEIGMRETAMLAADVLVAAGRDEEASRLFKSPADILRYLWYKNTGKTMVIEPRTLIAQAAHVNRHIHEYLSMSRIAKENMKQNLRLKYSRTECRRVALWLNALPMDARQAVEIMNPKRDMWVRMIHALRLGEYSRKEGFERLAEILDVFYRDEYVTWQGRLDMARRRNDAYEVLELLKTRPGLFARCLFATMLRFGAATTLQAFDEVSDRLPARLLLSLQNAAESWFDPQSVRIARPVTGVLVKIEPNRLLKLYGREELSEMQKEVGTLLLKSMRRRFSAVPTESRSIYIDPRLYDIPLAVGDRTMTVQDTSCALQGTRFHVEGDKVRLFLQWGKGLPAQHLDMDLSVYIAFPDRPSEVCAYFNLTATGAKHGGDIRSIPDMVGTAEYVELDIEELHAAGAKYVVFTCNAYSCGALSPNLVVGWMDSAFPMAISEENGVAYDPGCVQHFVRISEGNLSKGLVFGVLEVESHEIIWLEMSFTGQTIENCDFRLVDALLKRLRAKTSIGSLLKVKAEAQGLTEAESPDKADEAYTYEWALNPAAVSALLK